MGDDRVPSQGYLIEAGWDEPTRPPRQLAMWIAIPIMVIAVIAAGVLLRPAGTLAMFDRNTTIALPPDVPAAPPLSADLSTPSAESNGLSPIPLPVGQAVAGGPSSPIPWKSIADNGTLSATAIPGGIAFAIDRSGGHYWVDAPVSGTSPNMRVDGDVQFTSVPVTNDGIGLGCMDRSAGDGFAFFVRNNQTWDIDLLQSDGSAVIVVSGRSADIHPTGTVNHVSIACSSGGSLAHLMFAINGVPIGNAYVTSSTAAWSPAIAMCSCFGVSAGSFTNVTQSTFSK